MPTHGGNEVTTAIDELSDTYVEQYARLNPINATFDVTYSGGSARFVGVIVTSNGFGKPGDSGSLMVTNDGHNNPVGILFGGDNHGSGIVIPIGPVLDRFNVSLCRP